jgi:hypothetical protein
MLSLQVCRSQSSYAIIMPMRKTSLEARAPIDETQASEGRNSPNLNSPQGLSSKRRLQATSLIITSIPILILFVVSFIAYFNALFGNFIYDDNWQIVNNPWIRNIRNVPAIFSKGVLGFAPELGTFNTYRPMVRYHQLPAKALTGNPHTFTSRPGFGVILTRGNHTFLLRLSAVSRRSATH